MFFSASIDNPTGLNLIHLAYFCSPLQLFSVLNQMHYQDQLHQKFVMSFGIHIQAFMLIVVWSCHVLVVPIVVLMEQDVLVNMQVQQMNIYVSIKSKKILPYWLTH